MKTPSALTLLYGLVAASKASWSHVPRSFHHTQRFDLPRTSPLETRSRAESRYLSSAITKYAVNGTGIPNVNFDIGESYAGLLPISDDAVDGEMYFWFFPTVNEQHQDDKEIAVWLTGGPACTSLLGFIDKIGPWLWQAGTPNRTGNPFSWTLLTNVVSVDQPLGTGFSVGNVTITNKDELAEQFLGFWKNLVDNFALQGYKVYIATKSYGGVFGPCIASHMLDTGD